MVSKEDQKSYTGRISKNPREREKTFYKKKKNPKRKKRPQFKVVTYVS
jgi:23S rRNA maturation mini-RNase III